MLESVRRVRDGEHVLLQCFDVFTFQCGVGEFRSLGWTAHVVTEAGPCSFPIGLGSRLQGRGLHESYKGEGSVSTSYFNYKFFKISF